MKVSIAYDGKCPVCTHLARTSRLRERSAELELIDVRSQSVGAVQDQDLSGLDFDQGFAVVVDGAVHYGANGAYVLTVLTEPSGVFYRLYRFLMRTERRSAALYPLLRAGRGALLRLLGIPKIGSSNNKNLSGRG